MCTSMSVNPVWELLEFLEIKVMLDDEALKCDNTSRFYLQNAFEKSNESWS